LEATSRHSGDRTTTPKRKELKFASGVTPLIYAKNAVYSDSQAEARSHNTPASHLKSSLKKKKQSSMSP